MNSINDDIDLIERYFSNELAADEKELLMSRLTTESSLKKRFEQERLLVNAVKVEGAANSLAYLKDVESSISTIPLRRWIYYAAAASVTLFIATWFFLWPIQPQSEELFVAYFEPFPNVVEPVVRGDAQAGERVMAFQAYEAGEYERSAILFEELLEEEQSAGAFLLLGNAYLAGNKPDQAVEAFSSARQLSDEYDTDAEWYLSLALLRSDRIYEARELWKAISDVGSPYAEMARALLDETE